MIFSKIIIRILKIKLEIKLRYLCCNRTEFCDQWTYAGTKTYFGRVTEPQCHTRMHEAKKRRDGERSEPRKFSELSILMANKMSLV